MTERGKGNLAGAFGNVRNGGRQATDAAASARPGEEERRTARRKPRAKTGKRSRTEEYGQANGLVRHEVLNRWDRAKADPEVRAALESDLAEAGIEFKKGDPDFGAVCELLLGEWLESMGYGSDG